MVKIYPEIEQGTQEWYDIRKLKFTASNATTIMAMGKGVLTLIKNMLMEYYSSNNYIQYSKKYQSDDMIRGHEFEDKARRIYELETGNNVTQVGFVELSKHVGASPDGLIGEDGLIEIKNPKDEKFFELVTTGKIDKKYLDQMQMQLYVTGRKWCDFFAFNPNYSPCFFKKRVYPEKDKFMLLTEALGYAQRELLKQKDEYDKVFKK